MYANWLKPNSISCRYLCPLNIPSPPSKFPIDNYAIARSKNNTALAFNLHKFRMQRENN